MLTLKVAKSQEESKLKSIVKIVQMYDNILDLLPPLIEEIKELLDCDALTLFAIDRTKRELYSRNFISEGVSEIRVPISSKTLAGFVAAMGKPLNIRDAYSPEELARYHPELKHGAVWDQKLRYKTQSLMVFPLPYENKLIGVMEIINKKTGTSFTEADFKLARDLTAAMGQVIAKLDETLPPSDPVQEELSAEEKLHHITQAIHTANNVDGILIGLEDPILDIFDASMLTIYAVDTETREIYSKVKTGGQIKEIRLPEASSSIAAWVSREKKPLNIENVYNREELSRHDPSLTFDGSWDKESGVHTQSMLVIPLLHQKRLLGIFQLINKKNGRKFTAHDEKNAQLIGENLALAFSNQEKFVRPKPTRYTFLVENGLLTDAELTEAAARARKNRMDMETVLLDEFQVSRNDLGKSLEAFYGFPYYGYHHSIVLPREVLSGLNKNYLARNYWIPLETGSEKVVILINDPKNPDKTQSIRLIFPKREIQFKIGLKSDVIQFLNSVVGDEEDEAEPVGMPQETEELSSLLSALKTEQEEAYFDTSEDSDEVSAFSESDSTIVRLVNKILTDAYDQGISDIHIEPGMRKENMTVRFRKDGICQIYEEIPFLYKSAVLSRIKIMAKLDIAERRKPQDGKIRMKYGRHDVEYRVATCPTVGGNEDAVLRLLSASEPMPLDQMNFSERNLNLIIERVKKPHGLILVVGPTGSGKTTTLHSCLGQLNTPEKKIWTAEDPVEITQKGLRQVQMLDKIGLDFATAMRSFLRGDPDIIMVGEMRDEETCRIGLEASLTGHLVFSTLHTNSASETIVRLLDMGMNPLNFADAILLIAAQRLVRTLCPNCREDYHPDREEFDILVREYGENDFPKLGVEYSKDLVLKKPAGCSQCNHTGYVGRTALHELLDGTPEIKSMIMKRANVKKLRTQAIRDGMTTLKQDGIYKVFKGDCDLKQVLSVCMV